ncbi:hypothetical protein M316_0136 [Nitrincola phage 1M3-16]|uniref:hypothetical protein n=1 Tax=Nitrincola phage 1M3-16 TaxID=1472912 RepID=UPI000444B4DA|nr:hypothetical protein GJ22_gp016 [Nitrincola phage 1M3-16]AHX01201.1 hypothetical protein M316_0136 [Nitrincola phage 1M3-16]
MTFLDTPRINIRKYVYLMQPGGGSEFLHTFLSIEQARDYCKDHYRIFQRGDVYQIREVEEVVEEIVF